MPSRLAAWLVTGPLGHGYAGCADAAGLLLAVARRRIRDRWTSGRRRRRSRPDGVTGAAADAAQRSGR